MKTFCHRQECNFQKTFKDSPPNRCPACECWDLGVEKDGGWHKLSKLYAYGNGWGGPRNDERNLVQWFFHEQRLDDWRLWKRRLLGPSTFVPCPGNVRPRDFFLRPIERLYGSRPRHELFSAYPILHQLCGRYEEWCSTGRVAA